MSATPVDLEHVDPRTYANRWKILTVLCTSLMIVIIGNTALNVAIPRLASDLDASTSDLQWMVDSYALVFAGMLFTAGTLGDRFGRKGALQLGLALFLVSTVLAAVGTTSGAVIAARGLMGLAAAFVMPSTLSILTNVFPSHERAKAIAVWAGIAGGGGAVGPVASGFLLEHFWWGSVFLVNVPVIVLALVGGRLLIPTSSDPEQPPLDLPGALLSILGLGALVYGIIEGPHHGWTSSQTLGTFAFAAAGLAAFVWRELTARHPMLDLRYFSDRRFSVASGGMTLVFFAMFGTFFLVSQYFQLVLGYSPLESGLFQAPMAVVMMALSPQVPRIVGRFGVTTVVPLGLGSVSLGLLLFARMGVDTAIWWMYGPILALAVGMALTMTPLTTLIMSAVPLGKAGVGSAMNDTTRELGGALGVAVLGSLLTSTYAGSIGDSLGGLSGSDRTLAESGMVGAFRVAEGLGGSGQELVRTAKEAFVDGIQVASVAGAVVVAIAAVAAWRLLPYRPSAPTTVAGPATTDVPARAAGDTLEDAVPVPG
ncbi:MAG: MFS transporter [Acidimicrobiales bacterium]|nr:MFS transporter [Acidimicrobiales bacterium]